MNKSHKRTRKATRSDSGVTESGSEATGSDFQVTGSASKATKEAGGNVSGVL